MRAALLFLVYLLLAGIAMTRADFVSQSDAVSATSGSALRSKSMVGLEVEAEEQLESALEALEPKSFSISLKHVPPTEEEEEEELNLMRTHRASFLEIASNKTGLVETKSKTKIGFYSLKLKDLRNSEFAVTIGVGTPPVMMDVIPDTGSSNFWVNSERCPNRPCRIHHRFDRTKSSTYHSSAVTMRVRYGSGSLSGVLATEAVRIGPIHVEGANIGLIEQELGSVWMSGAMDGILGLSFQKLSASSRPLLMDSIIDQELLEENMFSFFYSNIKGTDSSMSFGSPDKALMVSAMVWIPVSRAMYWEVNMPSFTIGGVPGFDSGCSAVQPCRAVLDTGTSYYTAPSSIINQLYSKLPSLKRDCSNMHEFPALTFQLGDMNFDIEPQYYIEKKRDDCFFTFMSLDVPAPRGPLFILGDMFHRKFYTTYDHGDKPRLGFAMSINTKHDHRHTRPPYKA